ncbi:MULTISPECIES: hypothetical protein [Actinomycetes]|uniref:hypothetical protein n=1 Tax=Actinomycetes TaxID=1760 RepID=UPI0033FFE47F
MPEQLTDADRQFLTFALGLAADRMASRGDEFTDEDDAALAKLRRWAKGSNHPRPERLHAAARRALDALDDLIRTSSDPGAEALGARHELAQALINP